MLKKQLAFLLGLLFPFLCSAQLTVTPTLTTNPGTANTLAQIIGGNGVTVTNATINCGDSASGSFNYVGGSLGISSGIVLTTGSAMDASNPGGTFASVPNLNLFSDPDLIAIEPNATNDVCILEFDFVPLCNSLSITFVFGSEEYPTFVGSFNDGFGIFLTGPNPGGGNYTSQNIGTLPNGTPVSINNVNPTTNTAYFVDNFTAPNNDIVYDGYTIPITSVTPVKPCSTYHMKIAIADALDEAYDSGVFIGNNAISCATAPSVTVASTPSNCSGNTGTATASVTNYTGTPTYTWSPGGQNTASITGLSAGTYTCVVGMQLGCGNVTQTVTTTVAQTGSTLSLTTSTVNPTCNNGSNGSATVNIAGGTAPFNTSWNTAPVQNTTAASNLAAGTFVVTVQDNAGCVQTATVTLTNPAVIQPSTSTTPSTCSSTNGTATANVLSGGTAPFTYVWGTTPVQNTQTATGLAAGTYSVLISDVNTCTATVSAVVGLQNGGWTVAPNTPTAVVCFGGNTGAASVTISNPGANVFNYSWNTNPVQNTQTAVSVTAGVYTCSVSDANGCTQTATVSISQPTQLTATTSVAPTTCTASIGSSTVSPGGGTPPYTYSWNSSPAQGANVANNLGQGAYIVTVTDAHSCTVTANSTILTQNKTITVSNTSTSGKCGSPTGSITLSSIAGGTAPYTFSWNSTPVQNTQNLTNVVPGNYTVSITDAHGCTLQYPATVGNIPGLPLTVNTISETCLDGTGSAIVSANGTAPYQYLWNTVPPQTTQTATGLHSGLYEVYVADAFGCTDSIAVIVTNKNDVLSANFGTFPGGEINAGDPIVISMSTNQGWNLDTAILIGIGGISNYEHHVFTQYGTYYASYYFTSSHGCKDSLIYPIKVTDYMTLYIPSSFSPNGDGLNDYFRAEGTFISAFEIYIYDRWGKLVKKIDNIYNSWDGTYHGVDAVQDTYVYKGTVTDVFGKHVTIQGQINLIR